MIASPGLFEAFGIELEYMIVDRASLDVRPLSDRILHSIAGTWESEVEVGELAWSNELVLHVIELKTNGPRQDLVGLSELVHRDLERIEGILEPLGARLMPTAMHPWMDPETETRLWPHEHNAVYEAFDRIFDCRGHGWANLQSIHINLPFQGEEEFGRLHAAIRLVLPILPALAASSPFCGGARTEFLDTRLDFYRRNCARVPAVAGRVIPERVFTPGEYESGLLGSLYRAIAPFDPDGVLCHEWLNARGAIARFDRSAIEIRLLDVQECPRADIAIAVAVIGLVRALVEERWVSWDIQKASEEDPLAQILDQTIRDADRAMVRDPAYLSAMDFDPAVPVPAGRLWAEIIGRVLSPAERTSHGESLGVILGSGPLSRRLLAAWDGTGESLREVYAGVCDSMRANRMFGADV